MFDGWLIGRWPNISKRNGWMKSIEYWQWKRDVADYRPQLKEYRIKLHWYDFLANNIFQITPGIVSKLLPINLPLHRSIFSEHERFLLVPLHLVFPKTIDINWRISKMLLGFFPVYAADLSSKWNITSKYHMLYVVHILFYFESIPYVRKSTSYLIIWAPP